MHIVILTSNVGYPNGFASTGRIRLLARALAECGDDVGVLCTRAVDRVSDPLNLEARGTIEGGWFAYSTGESLVRSSFVGRRWSATKGFANALVTLLALRRRRRLTLVLVYAFASNWNTRFALMLAVLRLCGIPLVTDLVELPWSMKPSPTLPERLVSPMWPFEGAFAISGRLAAWVGLEAARLDRRLACRALPILVDSDEQAAHGGRIGGVQAALIAASPAYQESLRFSLAVMRRVWMHHPGCRLVVTGVDPSDGRLAWLWAELQPVETALVDVVGYLGRGALLDAYARSSVLLAPLFADEASEARFPTKIGEYLASGAPVVTSGTAEIRRWLSNEVDAMVVDPGDVAGFAAAAIRLLSDLELGDRIGAAGRALAQRHFDYRAHAQSMHEFLSGLCAPS